MSYFKSTFLTILSIFIFYIFSFGQDIHCYPTHWWTKMKYSNIQIMIHGKDVANNNAYSISYPGVHLRKVHKVENPNYLFLDVYISSDAKPGTFYISSTSGKKKSKIAYTLQARKAGNGTQWAKGVTSSDLIYLIMPDRFSNGDSTNDHIAGMRDQSLNRDSVFERHGGDLKGVENHLSYLETLGVTAIWLNPVIENDMPERTEHGYAFTNHYKVDPRLGGAVAYHSLIESAHKRGMKIIQDAVYNHVGSYHFTVLDPPMKDWLHQWQSYTNTTYKEQTIFDPYASEIDRKKMQDGWFVPSMPDLNQQNPFVENFLIQHAIWTVEEFGIDGWRIDTYAYNDLHFMNRCNTALVNEYPKMTMFGETWVHGVINQAYFVQNKFDIPFKSNLQAATDFQLLWGIIDVMTKDFGWTDGVNKLYNTLAQDFVYKDPSRNVIFLDNHDLSRFYSVIGGDMQKYKAALSWLFTCRGIPQLYYGNEIGMEGFTSPNDGYVRKDFPGGWPGDPQNKFLEEGRTEHEDSIYRWVKTLANYRKKSSAITSGKMMQYVSAEGEYVYFRYDRDHTIMVAMNTAKKPLDIKIENYDERASGFSKMENIINGETKPLADFTLQPMESGVWELLK